jgi:hypothetical protein
VTYIRGVRERERNPTMFAFFTALVAFWNEVTAPEFWPVVPA